MPRKKSEDMEDETEEEETEEEETEEEESEETEKKEEGKPKKRKQRYEITTIATQTAPVIKDNETGEMYDVLETLCRIANSVDKIERNLS